MQRSWKVRAAGWGLVLALLAPAAGASPLGGWGGSFFAAWWGWVVGVWEKEGPAGHPDGQPAACTGCPLDNTDEGPAGDPFG